MNSRRKVKKLNGINKKIISLELKKKAVTYK